MTDKQASLQPHVRIEPYGDAGIMVTATAPTTHLRRSETSTVRERLLSQRPQGIDEVVAGLESVLITFDPLVASFEHLDPAIRMAINQPTSTMPSHGPRSFRIPVVFDAHHGPDLAEVSSELGISSVELIDRLSSSPLEIALLGAAMAPMMNGLKVPSPVRRRTTPRTNVVPGSIMIADTNAIIQPFPGPSGWRVIGRTSCRLVDIERSAPISFAPGDRVRLEPVNAAQAAANDGAFLEPEVGA